MTVTFDQIDAFLRAALDVKRIAAAYVAVGRFPDISAHGVEEAVLRRFLTFPRPGYATSGVSAG
jgi:hypothetical protein